MLAENLILMIEDSDEDFTATARAFKKFGFTGQLKRTSSAREALDFLDRAVPPERAAFSRGAAKTAAEPALILLDLNLPGADGRELLVEIKSSERFRQIPVVILTTSANPRDISYCYRHGASSYHVKSVGFEKYSASIKKIISYWFNSVTLPSSIH